MNPENLVVAARCVETLGADGLARLATALHPKGAECQTCLHPLDDTPVCLTIDELATKSRGPRDAHDAHDAQDVQDVQDKVAVARLHHRGCREPEWNSGAVVVLIADSPTFSKTNFVILGPNGFAIPVVMLNPGLETVFIGRFGHRWRPLLPARFRKAGMVSNTDPSIGDGWPPKVSAITARIVHGDAIQIVGPDREDRYPLEGGSTAPKELIKAARREGVLLFALTHAVNPIDVRTLQHVQEALDHPLTLVATVRVT